MHHNRDERNGVQSSFDREAFRQVCIARMENMENNERNRLRRWISATSSSSSGSQAMISSRPVLVDLNNNPSSAGIGNQNAVSNQRDRKITSIEISSPAKHKLWLLGQRYSSSSSFGDAQSVAGSSSSAQSIAGPVSPPSLRNKRTGNLDNYNPLQMLLLHASRHDDEVERVNSMAEDFDDTPVQGGHILQLLNQIARSHDAQPAQSPPTHLDCYSTDDDDGSSMLSNVSSFISPTQIFCSDRGRSAAGSCKCHRNEDDDNDIQESDYFSSLCKVQAMLSELDQEESHTNVKKNSDGDSELLENEDWGLLSCIALSLLVVISILLTLSGIFSLQAKVNTWKESLAIRLWEAIERYETSSLEKLVELYAFRSSASALLLKWADAMTRQFSNFEALYLNTLNDLLRQRHRVFVSFSLNNVTSLLRQQLKRLGECTSNFSSNVDVTSVALEQFYRVAKSYYLAIELFKSAQSSFMDIKASTAMVWNATLFIEYLQQVGVTISESKKWLVDPLAYNTQEYVTISKASLTIPIIFDVGIDNYRNGTTRYQEEDGSEEMEKSIHIISPPFWRRQARAFVKPVLPVVGISLITQPSSILQLDNVAQSTVVCENLTALVVQRMRNSKQLSKPFKQKSVRDYYNSFTQQRHPDEKDIFDGVDVMSMASDAIVRWWHQHKQVESVKE